MRACCLLLLAMSFVVFANAQDWQDCKPEGSYSFTELKDSVHSMTTGGFYTGWHEKAFNRSGDLAALAILQTLNDTDMESPETLKRVLLVLRSAFACPHRCVNATGDRQPRVTLLLLEHLHSHAGRKMQSSIDETEKFVLQQARSGD